MDQEKRPVKQPRIVLSKITLMEKLIIHTKLIEMIIEDHYQGKSKIINQPKNFHKPLMRDIQEEPLQKKKIQIQF